MGFSSMDDFVNKVTNLGQFWRQDWNKNALPTTAQTAGTWYSLFGGAGNPVASNWPTGSNLTFQTLTDQAQGAILNGGAVGSATKHILNANAFSAGATTMPAVLMLVDMLGYYTMTTTTTTGNQATINSNTFTCTSASPGVLTYTNDIPSFTQVQLTNAGGSLPTGFSTSTTYYTIRQSASTCWLASSMANAIAGTGINTSSTGTGTQTWTIQLPRYPTGAGVQMFVTPTTVTGAGTPNMSITYTNPSSTTGRTTPTVLPVGITTCPVGQINYSGTAAAGKYGPFMPLAAGDTGILSVQDLSISATYTSGTLVWVLCRPLFTLPMTTIGVAAERDFMNQLPSLPHVYDNACLAFLVYAGAATPVNSAFYGSIDFGWG